MKQLFDERLKKVIENLKKDDIGALLLTRGTDIKYLTGFTGEAGVCVVILTNNKSYLVTDGRFITQASTETHGYEIIKWNSELGMYGEVGKILKDLKIDNVYIDYGNISHANYKSLVKSYDSEVKNSNSYISNLRIVKDSFEIDRIKTACEITQQSFLAVLNKIKPGITEMEIRNLLEFEMRNRGSECVAFDTIIASGPDNGANPHATVSNRKIQHGDMITMDFGAKYKDYCSDMTRTITVGDPSPELKKIYNVVKEAKDAGVSKLKAGVKAKDICLAIKSVIEENGYVLPHGPGHGFGLDIHENPFLGVKNEYELEENVVITIEPGIYVPGLGGVRIEDDYLITKDGYELLTPFITQDLINLIK